MARTQTRCSPVWSSDKHWHENEDEFLYMVGTRVTHDACHYPDSGQTLYTEGEEWRIESPDGEVLKSGRCKSPPGRD